MSPLPESDSVPPWTSGQINLLTTWAKDAQDYKTYHNYASDFYIRWYHFIGVFKIIIATVAASSLFGNIGTNASEWLKVTQGSVVMLTAILGALQQFFNFGKLAENHNQASTCYYILATDILKELSLPESFRQSSTVFLNTIQAEIANLRKTCPSVSPTMILRAQSNTKQTPMFITEAPPPQSTSAAAAAAAADSYSKKHSVDKHKYNKGQYASKEIKEESSCEKEKDNLLTLERLLAQRRRRRMPGDIPPDIRYQLERQDSSIV